MSIVFYNTKLNFNKIPKQCEACPFTQDQINDHSVVLTRNCNGPAEEDRDYESTLTVRDGEPVAYDPAVSGSRIGRVACTNRGANLWRDALQAQYTEAVSE